MRLSSHVLVFVMSMTTFAHAINLDLESLSEKKHQLEKAYKKYKDTKQSLKNKYKRKKEELKGKLKIFQSTSYLSSEDQEDVYVYLSDLLHRCESGSIDALNEACEFFETDSIAYIKDAILAYLEELEFLQEDDVKIELCKLYIGDDGLEYDDGEVEETTQAVSFYSLPLHTWEKKVIEKLISNMGEKSIASLLLDRKEMEKRGDQIHHVHPLRFMGYAIGDPYLKSCINQFRNQAFKWTYFLDGFVSRMKEEMAKNNILPHLDGFCEHLKVNYEDIYELANKGNYADLLTYLLDH